MDKISFHTIGKFDGTNYQLWKSRITMLLITKQLKHTLDQPSDTATKAQIEKYKSNSELALAEISTTIVNSQ